MTARFTRSLLTPFLIALPALAAPPATAAADKPTPIKKEELKVTPKPPVLAPEPPRFPSPAPIAPPPPSSTRPPTPIPVIPPFTPPPPSVTLTTHVRAPNNPRVMKVKGGNPAQQYLGNYDDMRDLEITLANTKAQYESSKTSVESYAKLMARQRTLYEKGTISQAEYEQSVFDLENARALLTSYESLLRFYEARRSQKEYQANVAAKKVRFVLADFYDLYVREWKAQCDADHSATEAAVAQLRLNQFIYDITKRIYEVSAGSYFDLESRLRDLVAAREDLAAKRETERLCPVGRPTLDELKQMMIENG